MKKMIQDKNGQIKELRDRLGKYETVDDELKLLEVRLIDWFRARLSETEMTEIRDDVSEFLSEEEDPEFFQKMVTDTIRVHFALPHLTLLG